MRHLLTILLILTLGIFPQSVTQFRVSAGGVSPYPPDVRFAVLRQDIPYDYSGCPFSTNLRWDHIQYICGTPHEFGPGYFKYFIVKRGELLAIQSYTYYKSSGEIKLYEKIIYNQTNEV